MFSRWGLSEAERTAVYAEGGDLPVALGLERPLISEPSRRMIDLPPGAIAAALYNDPNRTIAAIINSLPANPSEDDYTQAVNHARDAMHRDPTIGPIYETIRTMNNLYNGNGGIAA